MIHLSQFLRRSVFCFGFLASLSSPLAIAQIDGGRSNVSYNNNTKTVTFSTGVEYSNSLYAEELYQALDVEAYDSGFREDGSRLYAKTAGVVCYKDIDSEMISRHYCKQEVRLVLDPRSLPIVNFGQNVPLWRALKKIAQSGKYEAFRAIDNGGYEFEGGEGSLRIVCNANANCMMVADNILWVRSGNDFIVQNPGSESLFYLHWTGDEAREIMSEWNVPSDILSGDFGKNVRKKIFGTLHPTESRFWSGSGLGCFADSYVGRDTEVECILQMTLSKPVTMNKIRNLSLSQEDSQAIRRAMPRSRFPYILNGSAQLYCPREENQVCRISIP